jgi:acetyltransferase-like isoleucine patch superfamily enzyme
MRSWTVANDLHRKTQELGALADTLDSRRTLQAEAVHMTIRYKNIQAALDAGLSLPKSVSFDNSWLDVEVKNGSELVIGDLCEIRGRIIVEDGARVIIGSGLICNAEVSIQAAEKGTIKIGNDCLFANPQIFNSDMHSIFSIENNDRLNPSKDVIIGNRVWMATNSLALKGSDISDDSVIGAGTVVSKKYPQNVVIAGNPGKVVRENIAWSRSLVDRRSVTFKPCFSESEFRAAATLFNHKTVIDKGLPYWDKWNDMDHSNCHVFYYIARSLLIELFYKSRTFSSAINDTTIELDEVFQVLQKAFTCNSRNSVCGAYAYQASLMLNLKEESVKIFDAIVEKWPNFPEDRFKSPWPQTSN